MLFVPRKRRIEAEKKIMEETLEILRQRYDEVEKELDYERNQKLAKQ